MPTPNRALDRLVDDAMLVSSTRYVCARVEHALPQTWAVALYDRDPVSAAALRNIITPFAVGTGSSLGDAVAAAHAIVEGKINGPLR